MSNRLFLCACCKKQASVCSSCDRGQIYCSPECATRRRRESVRAAGCRYQRTPRGAERHAARQRRYRTRTDCVTHHGMQKPSERPKTEPNESFNHMATAASSEASGPCCIVCAASSGGWYHWQYLGRRKNRRLKRWFQRFGTPRA